MRIATCCFFVTPNPLPARSAHEGAYAADRQQWPEHAAALDSIRAQAGRLLAAGDTVGSNFTEAAAKALDAYGLWRRDQRDAALHALEGVLREATGYGERESVNEAIRFWLGRLYLEAGRPADATRCFDSLRMSKWPALLFLGRAYEAAGEPEKARRAYELFALAWKDADPDLQPRVQEARAAIQRLSSVVRE